MASGQTTSTSAATRSPFFVSELAQRRWRWASCAWMIFLTVGFTAALVGFLRHRLPAGWGVLPMLLAIGGILLTLPPVQPRFDEKTAHRYRWARRRIAWCLLYGGGAVLAYAGSNLVGEITPYLIAILGSAFGVRLLLAQKATEP